MSVQQQQFIQILIETGDKLSLCDFFKTIHSKFYSDYDISFMEYFLELTTHEGEFVVHHEKLVEYGIMTSGRSSAVKTKLDALELVENIDYSLPNDVRAVGRCARNKTYQSLQARSAVAFRRLLTPEAFKNCLLRARKYPNQKVDPVIYSKYYLLLEKYVFQRSSLKNIQNLKN